MARCVIFTAGDSHGITKADIGLRADDFVICSDGGYALAQNLGVFPQLIVGDFDSYTGALPDEVEILRYIPDKDDTDTLLAIKHGAALGYSDFLLVAATGGRLDHTVANLQNLAFIGQSIPNSRGEIVGAEEHVFVVCTGGNLRLCGTKGQTFSVLCHSQNATGVFIKGADFPLDNAVLSSDYPIGISNRISLDMAEISIESGTLLVFIPNIK